MRTCYFCTTPFQIMSTISMTVKYKEDADIYIMNQFLNANKMGEVLRKSGIFRNVRVVNEDEIYKKYINVRKKGGLYNYFKVAMAYLHVDEIAELILIEEPYYKKMYISTKSYMARFVMLHFMKHHMNIEIVHFDDGAGSYNNPACYRPSRSDAIVRTLLFGRESIDVNKRRILYSPELYRSLNPNSPIQVEQMPCLWEEKSIKAVINKMFDFEETDAPQEKVILLDTIKEEVFNEEEQHEYSRICMLINDAFKKENLIVKKHPRDGSNDERFSYYYKNFMPFEVLALNTDISSKIIISYASTAVATPKMIFDKEPTIILLYKLIKKEKADPMVLLYYEAYKKLYRKECFYIPETEEELLEIIKKLRIR